MRHTSRFAAILIIATLAMLSVTACSSNNTSAEPGASTIASAVQIPNTSVPLTLSVAPTTPDVPTVVDASPATSAVQPAPVVLPAPNRDDVNVDARDFQDESGFYFDSPSHNVHCALQPRNQPGLDVGCEAVISVPGNTGTVCGNQGNSLYGVRMPAVGPITQSCMNQPFFSINNQRVLEYGQVIGVLNTSCRSTEQGITCYAGGDDGFMISRDINTVF